MNGVKKLLKCLIMGWLLLIKHSNVVYVLRRANIKKEEALGHLPNPRLPQVAKASFLQEERAQKIHRQ